MIEPCFQTQLLLSDRISLITPKDHPWADRDFIEVEELLEEKFILPSEKTSTYLKVNEALAAKNLSLLQLDSFLTLDNPEAIALSVNKGLGLSFSSSTIATTISDTVQVPIKDINIEQGLYIVRDRTQLTTAARDAFWDYMSSAALEEKIVAHNS
jgi:DNA-binding transcriptional LysR family regulator